MCAMDTSISTAVFIYCLLMSTVANAFLETPKFSQLRLLYPGYPEYGGHYHQERLMRLILGQDAVDGVTGRPTSAADDGKGEDQSSSPRSASAVQRARHHSAAVRLSYTLNRYGGRHAVGTVPVHLTQHSSSSVDSFSGFNGQQYIFRNEAFGPFLAERYGNPEVVWTAAAGDVDNVNNRKSSSPSSPMSAFVGRQGIVRIVSFRRRSENGHVALWDCSGFHESRDWSTESHVISIEFWESADSHCPSTTSDLNAVPTPLRAPSLPPSLAAPDDSYLHVIPRHNFQRPPYLQDSESDDEGGHQRHRRVEDQSSSLSASELSKSSRGRRRRERHGSNSVWLQ